MKTLDDLSYDSLRQIARFLKNPCALALVNKYLLNVTTKSEDYWEDRLFDDFNRTIKKSGGTKVLYKTKYQEAQKESCFLVIKTNGSIQTYLSAHPENEDIYILDGEKMLTEMGEGFFETFKYRNSFDKHPKPFLFNDKKQAFKCTWGLPIEGEYYCILEIKTTKEKAQKLLDEEKYDLLLEKAARILPHKKNQHTFWYVEIAKQDITVNLNTMASPECNKTFTNK